MRMIDTHLHTINLEQLAYPWLSQVPKLNHNHSYATYAQEARQCGITDALHMEVDVAERDMEAETAVVQGLSREAGSLLRGVISACRPESSEFPAFLDRQRANGFVKGFRRVLHVMDTALSEGHMFRQNIARLKDTGLPFDLCVLPQQAPVVRALVDLNPDVQFVFDHCGVPDIKGGDITLWRDTITEMARRSNVVAKISGICAYAAENWILDDLRPYVEHTIACFGWDRVVWGSDWPVCTLNGSLSVWVAATHALLAGCSVEERAKLLHLNAARVWALEI
jgi:predicted TIM-barrel fold metal-dependent hydrolase